MKSRRTMLALAVAVAASAFATSASAAIMYTNWQQQSTGLRSTTGAITNLTFSRYDASVTGYALHNVEMECTTNGYAVYQFSDLSGAPNTFDFLANMNARARSTGITPALTFCNLALSISDIQRTVPGNGVYASPGFGVPPNFLAGLTATSTANPYYDVNSPNWATILGLFNGTGTVDIANSANIANLTTSTGDNTTALLSRYETIMRLRYSYVVPDQQAPEPVTLGLLGMGLAGMAVVSRRQKVSNT